MTTMPLKLLSAWPMASYQFSRQGTAQLRNQAINCVCVKRQGACSIRAKLAAFLPFGAQDGFILADQPHSIFSYSSQSLITLISQFNAYCADKRGRRKVRPCGISIGY